MIDALIPILKPLAPTLGGLLGTVVGGSVLLLDTIRLGALHYRSGG
jgi:hypothetical protein